MVKISEKNYYFIMTVIKKGLYTSVRKVPVVSLKLVSSPQSAELIKKNFEMHLNMN